MARDPNEPRFVHLRQHTDTGAVLPTGGVTIAFKTQMKDTGFEITYAAARCHWRDLFNKKVARAKAGGRLRSSRWTAHIIVPDETTNTEVIERVIAAWLNTLLPEFQDKTHNLY